MELQLPRRTPDGAIPCRTPDGGDPVPDEEGLDEEGTGRVTTTYSRTPVPASAGSQAVDRAAALLAAVVQSPQPRSFTWLVEELGLARSTTSRLLQALERNRLVQRDRTGSYRPGPLFAVYAAREQTAHDLVELARPALERIAAATGETVNFAVPRGDGVVPVAQLDGRYLLGTTNWVGVDAPAHCTALGKVLYAFGRLRMPSGPLERRTAATITTPELLERDLVEVRRRGWAVAAEELETGLVAVAAPVRSPDSVVGAVSVSAPTARLSNSQVQSIGELLVRECGEVSSLLGHRTAAWQGKEETA
jgi:IclR family transcriptional regulator, acetate operon repressor